MIEEQSQHEHLTGTVGLEDLASLFGTSAAKVDRTAGDLLAAMDLRVRRIQGAERDTVILEVLRRITSPELKEAGPHREQDWEDGWRENLDEFAASGFNVRTLIPKYYRNDVPIRMNRQYVKPLQSDFIYRYTEVFRAWLFAEYFADVSSIYEFGCGTGHNLVHLDQLHPGKALYGFDWARSSQQILALLRRERGMNIAGAPFNFFDPDDTIAIERDGAVFTLGALEQIGSGHTRYVDFLMRRRPALCVDVVGLEELYDETNLLDYLALMHHRRRNYLRAYVTRLRELEAQGKVEILKLHRHQFGNQFDEPYSYVVWRPR